MKHNKKRNTAFLYEVLVKEATERLYVKNDIKSYSDVISLIREMSSKGEMAAELKLYLALRNQVKTKTVARSILSDVLAERLKIDNKKLFNEQTNFISNTFIGDYRSIGNLYHLFNNYSEMDIKSRNVLKESVIHSMVESQKDVKSVMEPVDTITYNILVKKFNEKYSGVLSESQKELIVNYIVSGDDENSFKVYLGEEVERLSGRLAEAIVTKEDITSDPEMIQKGKEILGVLEEFKTKRYDTKMIEGLMKIQKLIEEIDREDEPNDKG